MPPFLIRLLAALCVAAPLLAAAQGAAKPLRLVVPFPAGGATDLLARTLAQRLRQGLGTTVVVENRAGAGGSLGSAKWPTCCSTASSRACRTSRTASSRPWP